MHIVKTTNPPSCKQIFKFNKKNSCSYKEKFFQYPINFLLKTLKFVQSEISITGIELKKFFLNKINYK